MEFIVWLSVSEQQL